MTETQYNTLKELLKDYDRTTGDVVEEQAQTNALIKDIQQDIKQLKNDCIVSNSINMILSVCIILLIVINKNKK